MPKLNKLENLEEHYTLRIGAEDDPDPILITYLPSRLPDDMFRLDWSEFRNLENEDLAEPQVRERIGQILDTVYEALASMPTKWNLERADSNEVIPLEVDAIRREIGPINAIRLFERISNDIKQRRELGNSNGSNSEIASLEARRRAKRGATASTKRRKA